MSTFCALCGPASSHGSALSSRDAGSGLPPCDQPDASSTCPQARQITPGERFGVCVGFALTCTATASSTPTFSRTFGIGSPQREREGSFQRVAVRQRTLGEGDLVLHVARGGRVEQRRL